MRLFFAVVSLAVLGACGDPLARFDKVSEMDLEMQERLSIRADAVDAAWPEGALVEDAPEQEMGAARKKAPGLLDWLRGNMDLVVPQDEVARVNSADAAVGLANGPLGFGDVRVACDARGRPLGTKVAASETRGVVYKIYDTEADQSTLRRFYVTGFADGCPREFKAALAIFGSASMHEHLRYGHPSKEYPYSETDTAYEEIKARVCKVGKGKPCGRRIENLERNTVFISVYERFTENGRWADILLHDGALVATALKTP